MSRGLGWYLDAVLEERHRFSLTAAWKAPPDRDPLTLRPLVTYADVLEMIAPSVAGAWIAMPRRLDCEAVEWAGHTVPLWAPDPERAAWRRRKWWGRWPLEVDAFGKWWRWAETPW
jgi:hypothetical protein